MSHKGLASKKTAKMQKKFKINKASGGNNQNPKIVREKKGKNKNLSKSQNFQMNAMKDAGTVTDSNRSSNGNISDSEEGMQQLAKHTLFDEDWFPDPNRVKHHYDGKPAEALKTHSTGNNNEASALTVVSTPTLHELPSESLVGAQILSMHAVCARDIQQRVSEFESKFDEAKKAVDHAMLASQAIMDAVDTWKAAWAAGC